ncbi:SDR family NAD(P)-dependent oxidoreductase [Chloroflexota bacterium]
MRLAGKVAIITGSTRGIGRATALAFAREGAKVTIVARNKALCDEVVDEISKKGGEAFSVPTDITNETDVAKIVNKTMERFKCIDILVNNAGGAIPELAGPFAESKISTWEKNINLNLYAVLYCTRAVINHMLERKSGKIINVSSVGGVKGNEYMADYSAAKGGVIAFTKALAKEVGPYGVNVNCISPGSIITERTSRFPEEFSRKIAETIHLKRSGVPDEIANVILFLATDEASYVHGANFVVDGGMTLAN